MINQAIDELEDDIVAVVQEAIEAGLHPSSAVGILTRAAHRVGFDFE